MSQQEPTREQQIQAVHRAFLDSTIRIDGVVNPWRQVAEIAVDALLAPRVPVSTEPQQDEEKDHGAGLAAGENDTTVVRTPKLTHDDDCPYWQGGDGLVSLGCTCGFDPSKACEHCNRAY